MPSEASPLPVLTPEDRTLLIGCLDQLIADWSGRLIGDTHPAWTAEDVTNAAHWVPLYRDLRARLAATAEGPVSEPSAAATADLARHMEAEAGRIAAIRQGLAGPGEAGGPPDDLTRRLGPVVTWRGLTAVGAEGFASLSLLEGDGTVRRFRLAVPCLTWLMASAEEAVEAYAVHTTQSGERDGGRAA